MKKENVLLPSGKLGGKKTNRKKTERKKKNREVVMMIPDFIKLWLYLLLSTLLLFPVIAQSAEEKEKTRSLEAKKSEELEKLLKKTESIENQIKEFSEEALLSGLAAALHSEDADVRFNAMGYLLSDEAVSDNNILPFLIELSEKMTGQKPLIKDQHNCNECYRLTKLFIKYPDKKAIPFLCFLAGRGPFRSGSSMIMAAGGESTGIYEAIGFMNEIAEAIEQCTNGEIIKPTEHIRFSDYTKIEPIVATWEKWYEENKSKEEKEK
jgi:cell division protein FtsB